MSEDILSALQFDFLNSASPINTTGNPAFQITYDFATNTAPSDLPLQTAQTGWTPMTEVEKAAIRTQMAHIETVVNVTFVEAPGAADPDLNLGKITVSGDTTGLGGTSVELFGTTVTRWDGFSLFDNTIDLSQPDQANLVLHEISHAMGAKHPFEDGAVLPAETENNKYTVMSYNANPDSGTFSNTLMLYDLLILQDIWGAPEANTGKSVYQGPTSNALEVIWDTDGNDRLDANGRDRDVKLDLREGAFSSFDSRDDIVIAFGATIEKATGGNGDDRLIGNASNNDLKGKFGNDSLKGGSGKDILHGGQGDDVLRGGNGRDKLLGGEGNDLLIGGKGKDVLNGVSGSDTLTGNGGADRFVFTNSVGAHVITDFQDGLDSVVFRGNGDLDRVLSFAEEQGGDVIFDFDFGNTLTVQDTTLANLRDDILIG
ncbi:MAG: M10 family metallopeptidase [Arenibacterium sp.]